MASPVYAVRRSAFTLVELLVALSLVAVIGTMALLLLTSTQDVADEVAHRSWLPPAEDLLRPLENELLHLYPQPPDKEWPRFELKGGTSLLFTSHIQQTSGDRIPVICRYEPSGTHTLRILQSPYWTTALTNRLDTVKGPLQFEAHQAGQWVRTWPPPETDSDPTPPVLLRVSGDFVEGDSFSHILAIPAHLRISPTFSDSETDGDR